MQLFMTCVLLLGALSPTTHAQDSSESTGDSAKLRVIATIPTYGLLAEELGQDLVEVITVCRPGQDLHGVMATPAFMARVRSSDLLFYTGLDAELWLDGMLRGAGAVNLLPGNPNAIVMSTGVPLKEVPAILDRSQGDVHAFGNPHMWTDPLVVRDMATRVGDALVRLLPEHAEVIRDREEAFRLRLTKALVRWLTDYASLANTPLVTYHQSWRYFLDRFRLVRVGTLEPKPRVMPTSGHLTKLVETMQARDVKLVIREPWQHPQASEFVAERVDVTVLALSTHPGWPEGTGIIEHFEHNLAEIARALDLPVSDPGE
ncbi:MAG: zinc ABC transporter substrate-binding protein [Planctomycetota bacterium]|nr:MAG: zinc ABC transporter substrate-binding protein [Planctomycetota bacterium]